MAERSVGAHVDRRTYQFTERQRLPTSHRKSAQLMALSGLDQGVFSRKQHEMCPFPPSNAVETITS